MAKTAKNDEKRYNNHLILKLLKLMYISIYELNIYWKKNLDNFEPDIFQAGIHYILTHNTTFSNSKGIHLQLLSTNFHTAVCLHSVTKQLELSSPLSVLIIRYDMDLLWHGGFDWHCIVVGFVGIIINGFHPEHNHCRRPKRKIIAAKYSALPIHLTSYWLDKTRAVVGAVCDWGAGSRRTPGMENS